MHEARVLYPYRVARLSLIEICCFWCGAWLVVCAGFLLQIAFGLQFKKHRDFISLRKGKRSGGGGGGATADDSDALVELVPQQRIKSQRGTLVCGRAHVEVSLSVVDFLEPADSAASSSS